MIVYRKYGTGGPDRKRRIVNNSAPLQQFKESRNLVFSDSFKEKLFNAIAPSQYANLLGITKAAINVTNNNVRDEAGGLVHNELWAKDLGGEGNFQFIEESPHKPTIGDQNITYHRLKNYDKEEYLNSVLARIDRAIKHDAQSSPLIKMLLGNRITESKDNTSKMPMRIPFTFYKNDGKFYENPLARYTIYRHDVPNNRYISYYDIWDFKNKWLTDKFVKPVEIYDRIYYTEDPEYPRVTENLRKADSAQEYWHDKYLDTYSDMLKKYGAELPKDALQKIDAAADSLVKYNDLYDGAKKKSEKIHKYKVVEGIPSTPSRELIKSKQLMLSLPPKQR